MRLLFTFLFASFLFTSCSSSDNSDSNDDDIIIENPALKVTVTASVIDEGNGINGIDDIIEYTISIHNTGDVTLSSILLANALNDFSNNELSLDANPNFISASLGSVMGFIQASEIATYSANFTITQNEVDADGLSYSVTVNALTPQNISVSDVSDNGDDSDGNIENDLTETTIEFDPLIIAEYHELNSSGTIYYKYKFDSNGRINEMINLNETNNNYTYNFDSENRLINITRTDAGNMPLESIDITYNSENKIESINDRTFSYNPDLMDYVPVSGYTLPGVANNFYIDDTSYYADEEPTMNIDQEIIFTFFVADLNGQVIGSCQLFVYRSFLDEISEFCNQNDIWQFTDNLLVTTGNSDFNVQHEFDTLINPVFQGATNITNLAPFLNNTNFDHLVFNKNFLSMHNRTHIAGDSDGGETTDFIYEFNALNLPIQSTIQYYQFGILDNEFIYGKYYYQGDEIPD